MVYVRALLGTDSFEPYAASPEHVSPRRTHPPLLDGRYPACDRFRTSGCSHSPPHLFQKPHRLAILRDRFAMGSDALQRPVRHLHITSSARLTPSQSSSGMDDVLGLGSSLRPHCVLASTVSW